VTLVAVGTCTIQATQAGNHNCAVATPVIQSCQPTQDPCDLRQNGNVNAADVQLIIEEAPGAMHGQ
jgi:hypothetical protein